VELLHHIEKIKLCRIPS